MQKIFLTLSLIASLTRCGHPTSNTNEIAISNGVDTSPGEFSEAVLVVGADGINPILFPEKIDPTKRPPDTFACTGIHVSKNVVLTAARCAMCPSGKKLYQRKCKPEELSVYDHAVERVFFHAKFNGVDLSRNLPNDLALLYLKDPLPLPFAKFCHKAPNLKERVVMVGFGQDNSTRNDNEEKTGNRKRVGNNIIHSVSNEGIFVVADEEKSSADPLGEDTWFTDGDIGGPLYQGKCVVGVASSFKLPLLANETKVENFYVNMLLDENLKFVRDNR